MKTDRRKLLAAALLTGATTNVVPGAALAARTTEAAGDAEKANGPRSHAVSVPQLKFAFNISLTLGEVHWLRPTDQGSTRGAVYVTGGKVEGPDIRGVVIPQSGADWPLQRPDGVLDFDARYLLRTDDGVVIYMQNRGYRWGPPEVMAALSRRENVDPSAYYMRTAPRFDVPAGRYAWMSRHVFVGVAEKTPQGNSINYFMLV
jgi:hypothetical protein